MRTIIQIMRRRRRAAFIAAGLVCAIVLAVLACCGCVATKGSYQPGADGKPKFEFRRYALFYPFALEDVAFPDGTRIGKYTTSGGATELVPLVDAGGKLLGYVVKGAVEGAK